MWVRVSSGYLEISYVLKLMVTTCIVHVHPCWEDPNLNNFTVLRHIWTQRANRLPINMCHYTKFSSAYNLEKLLKPKTSHNQRLKACPHWRFRLDWCGLNLDHSCLHLMHIAQKWIVIRLKLDRANAHKVDGLDLNQKWIITYYQKWSNHMAITLVIWLWVTSMALTVF